MTRAALTTAGEPSTDVLHLPTVRHECGRSVARCIVSGMSTCFPACQLAAGWQPS